MNPDWLTRAENSSTSESELHALMTYALEADADKTRPLVLALAANPNLAPEDLLTLLANRPSSMKVAPHNPAFTLNALADPAFFDQLSWTQLRQLLSQVDVPEWICQWLMNHPHVPVTLAARWHVSQSPTVDWQAELQGLLPALRLWHHQENVLSSQTVGNLSKAWEQGKLPLWAAERLASVEEKPLRLKTFEADKKGKLASWHQLLQRASGGKGLERIYSKYDPDLTGAELIRLAGGGLWARRLAARHPNAPEELLAWLATDAMDVRTAVLKNSATPESLKARMTEPTSHGYDVVRRLPNPPLPKPEDPLYPIAIRIGMATDSATALSSDFLLKSSPYSRALSAPDFTVRLHVALTEQTPVKARKVLSEDANALVRTVAQERL